VWGLGLEILGLGLEVCECRNLAGLGLRFGVGRGLMVQGPGLRVSGAGCRVKV